MSRRRPGISRSHGSLGWLPRTRQTVAESEPAAPASLPARVHHPVITPTHTRWLRVMRAFRTFTGIDVECIGEFPSETGAILCGVLELGHARVVDLHGKTLCTNGQPIERRDV